MNIIEKIQKRWLPKTLKCVYRKDILEYALKHHKYPNGNNHGGSCITIIRALNHYGIILAIETIPYYLPLFNIYTARKFNAEGNPFAAVAILYYWWPKGVWDTGRLEFLKWLLEQYKDDKTNLKEL